MKITYKANKPIFEPQSNEEKFILDLCLLSSNITAFRLGVGLNMTQEEIKKQEDNLQNLLTETVSSYKKL